MDKMTRSFLRAPLGLNKVPILDPWRWAAEPRLSHKSLADLAAWLATLVGQSRYLAAIIALFQPRYLSLFPRLLHPHGL